MLYNFEYVTTPDEHDRYWHSWITPEFVAVHKSFKVWDYSWCVSCVPAEVDTAIACTFVLPEH